MSAKGVEAVYATSLRSVQALIEEVLGEIRGCRGYAEDLGLALRSTRVDDTPFTLLPILCCQAVGGDRLSHLPERTTGCDNLPSDGRQATVVISAWRLLFLAARILDDLEDGDADNALWTAIGPARTINVANGLIFAAQLALAYLRRWGMADWLFLAIHEDFNHTALRICAGQHNDLAQEETSLDSYWETVAAKAGEPFALACRAGALVGGGSPQQVALLSEFGHNLGLLMQIGDDFHGVWDPSGRSDLAAGRKTLPVLYAFAVAPVGLREHLRELPVRATSNAEDEAEARQVITDLGTPQYLLVEAQLRYQRARTALQAVGPPTPAHRRLLALLDQILPMTHGQSEGQRPPVRKAWSAAAHTSNPGARPAARYSSASWFAGPWPAPSGRP